MSTPLKHASNLKLCKCNTVRRSGSSVLSLVQGSPAIRHCKKTWADCGPLDYWSSKIYNCDRAWSQVWGAPAVNLKGHLQWFFEFNVAQWNWWVHFLVHFRHLCRLQAREMPRLFTNQFLLEVKFLLITSNHQSGFLKLLAALCWSHYRKSDWSAPVLCIPWHMRSEHAPQPLWHHHGKCVHVLLCHAGWVDWFDVTALSDFGFSFALFCSLKITFPFAEEFYNQEGGRSTSRT